nr:unnamed protein product [Callosobruchus analis]
MFTSTYEGQISGDFDNGDNRSYCANSRQFSVSSLLRLGNKRRASDVDSGEGEIVFYLLFHYPHIFYYQEHLNREYE